MTNTREIKSASKSRKSRNKNN